MAKRLQILRNSTISTSREAAKTALLAQLAKLNDGELAINRYQDGTQVKVLFGFNNTVGTNTKQFVFDSDSIPADVQAQLDKLNGDGDGSISKQIEAAKIELIETTKDALLGGATENYNTLGKLEDKITSINDEISNLNTLVNTDADAIKVLNGDETKEGSVANAISKISSDKVNRSETTATDEKVAVEGTTVEAALESLAKSVKSTQKAAATYEFKDGLTINNTTEVSVKIDTDGEDYLSVGKNGIKINGIKAAIEKASYELPVATTRTLGGIIVGDNLTIKDDGTLSANNSYTLPKATDTTLGGVMSSTELETYEDKTYPIQVTDTGKMKVKVPWTDTDTHYTSKNVVNSTNTSTEDTKTALTNGNVYLNHVENNGVKSTLTSSHKILGSGATTVKTDENGNIEINSTDTNTDTNTAHKHTAGAGLTVSGSGGIDGTTTYSLETAAKDVLGGVKTTSNVTSVSDYIPTPIVDGVPYYQNQTVATNNIEFDANAKVTFIGTGSTTITGDNKNNTITIYSASSGGSTDIDVETKGNGTLVTDVSKNGSVLTVTKDSSLPDIPIVYDSKVTINQNGVEKGSFTLNQTGSTTINLTDTDTNTAHLHNAGDGLTVENGNAGVSNETVTYKLKAATTRTLGGIIVGDNLTIKDDGTLSANNSYTLPKATDTTLGGVMSSTELETYEDKTYPIQVTDTGKMKVKVPWTDTNTTYTAGDGLSLSGTTFSLNETLDCGTF